MPWSDFLEAIQVTFVEDAPNGLRNDSLAARNPSQIMHRVDGTFYLISRPFEIDFISTEWDAFMNIRQESRRVIVEALSEMRGGSSNPMMRRFVRHVPQSLEDYVASQKSKGEEQGNPGEHPE
jgi:hypothetical protein